ncbi:MAG: hypothetical protein ABW221_10350 [Vicinamibacteria bacterium]
MTDPSPRRERRYVLAAVVLLAQAALVRVSYPRPGQFGFVADAWGYLQLLREDGLLVTLSRPIGYHWQPVAILFVDLMRRVFGESAARFEAVNQLQLVSLGFLTYLLGKRVSGDAGVGLVASLLYLGSPIYYEATYWALAGNMHLLAAQFYLVTLLLAWEVGAGRLRRSGPWLVGACALLAVLTHPAMVTVIPVAGLALVLVSRAQGETFVRGDRRLALALLVVVGLVVVAIRVAIRLHLGPGQTPPTSFNRDGFFLIALMSAAMAQARGTLDAVFPLVAYGLGPHWPFGERLTVGLWVWSVGPLVALAWAWRVARTAGLPVVAVFFVVHLYALGLGGALSSRQTIVMQVPVALLVAWALHALADRLARWIDAPAATVVLRQLPVVAALVLLLRASKDHQLAARLTLQAGATMTALRDGVAAAAPVEGPPRKLVLVNPASVLVEGGIGTQLFRNGAHSVVRLHSHPQSTLEFWHVAELPALPYPVEAGVLTPAALRAMVADPSYVVFVSGPPPRVLERVDAAGVEVLLAGR